MKTQYSKEYNELVLKIDKINDVTIKVLNTNIDEELNNIFDVDIYELQIKKTMNLVYDFAKKFKLEFDFVMTKMEDERLM